MPSVIGIPKETAQGERRVAIIPETVTKFRALGADVYIEQGAGERSYFKDESFSASKVLPSAAEIFTESDIVLKVQPPSLEEIRLMRPGTVLAGFLHPYQNREQASALCERNITSFAVELVPRISRAQSMDALSSQATVAGYQCALIAAEHCAKLLPMLTYAAGTLRPARVLVIGAGVAGLQAIATAHRLGAVVEAYDVRPETREQVESLGGKFIETGLSASGPGGYARGLSAEEKKIEHEKLASIAARADVLITTAAVPGRRSPLIITKDMVHGMKQGAVIIDMAAGSGGNVAGVRPGGMVVEGGVKIIGPLNLASQKPVHASEMYARNLFYFFSPHIRNGEFAPDWNDEIIAATVFTRDGQIRHEGVKKALETADEK